MPKHVYLPYSGQATRRQYRCWQKNEASRREIKVWYEDKTLNRERSIRSET